MNTPVHIGLIRHFPVTLGFPSGWKTEEDLQQWMVDYDASPVRCHPTDLGTIPWHRCLSSDMPRAIATAQALHAGPIEPTALLREPSFERFGVGNLRLPVWLWRQFMVLAWATGHRSQRRCRDDFKARVCAMADRIESLETNTLIVSHAGMMTYLSRELHRRRFHGPKLKIPSHARLHVYHRTA